MIGARSRSFRFLVRLVERLPVLTLPAWRSFRTAPIDERDVVEMLAAAATLPTATIAGDSPSAERSLDIGGPDTLSYGEMIGRIAELMLVRRPVLGFGVNVTPVAARVAAAIASEDPDLILPLMQSLHGDLCHVIPPPPPPSCSACACTPSTRRSNTRSESGSNPSRCPRGELSTRSGNREPATVLPSPMSLVTASIDLPAAPADVWKTSWTHTAWRIGSRFTAS